MIPFVLLALTICAIWAPNLPSVEGKSIPSWLLLFIAAVIAGVVAGILALPAVASLVLLTGLAWGAQRQERVAIRSILIAATIILALAIALHRIPGFSNPLIVDRVRLTPDAAPFTLYANFDKGAAGAVLLAFFARRVRSWRELGGLLLPVVVATVATSAIVFAIAVAIAYTNFEPKLLKITPVFLAINLFFTCVAEEAMFRGLLQERMSRLLDTRKRILWKFIPIVVSALLFGAAHAAAGLQLVVLATLAGLGYSLIYARTRRIEAAILVHFLVNGAQFLLLTYPNHQK